MPELPEVETMRRGALPVVGGMISGIHRLACRLRPIHIVPAMPTFQRRVVGTRIRRLDRLGKRLLIWLETDHAIVFEPRMTGLILLSDPPTHEHLRFRLDLEGTEVAHLWYWDRRGLGSVRLLDRRQVEQQLGPSRLGPDALGVDAGQLTERLTRRRVPVKVALLDQSALAGVGNLYASEILHVARIHPGTRCDRLTRCQWLRLADSVRGVLEEAIHYEGSTLSDGTYRTALNHPGQYQNYHRVYARAGQLCASCGQAEIQRIVQAQRATFFCPACQGGTFTD
ncbi:MAG: bifunctional DNA-formamidopyrimidine glycosylase/DNA-(apurinic or apyrimidinic site) lyase [Pirellulaceae bacterium]